MDHWSAPDVPRDILAAARRPDLPEPTEIHVHPEVARMIGDAPPTVTDGTPVRIVVDAAIPQFPGYEIHRPV